MTPWTYAESRPPQLADYVDFLWHFEGPTEHRRKRILPNGKVELLVNLGEPYRTVEGRGLEFLREGCVSGMQSGPMVLEQPARQNVLGARLRPAGAYALLAAPVRETSGLVVGLDEVFPVRLLNADNFPTDLAAARRHKPDVELTVMPRVGHFLMAEDPEEFNRLLARAVRELTSAAPAP